MATRRLQRLLRHTLRNQRGQTRGEQTTHQRGTHGSTHLTEEVIRRRRGTNHTHRECILNNQSQELHGHTQTGTHHRKVHTEQPGRSLNSHGRQQEQAQRHNRGTARHITLIATGLRHHAARHNRHHQHDAHHRDHQQTSHRSAHTQRHLQISRDVLHCTEHCHTQRQRSAQSQQEVTVLEQVHGHNRLSRTVLHRDKHQRSNHREDQQTNNLRRSPLVLVATPNRSKHQRTRTRHQNQRAKVVDAVLLTVTERAVRQQENHRKNRQNSQRQIQPERPTPTRTLSNPAANQRTSHRRESKNATDNTHVAAAVAGRDHVSNHRLRQNHQTAAAQTLQGTSKNQPVHVLSERANNRTRHESDNRKNQEGLASELVRKLAVDRHRNRRKQDENGNHPAHVLHAVKLTDDRGQRRRQNRLVQRGHEHHNDQAQEHGADAVFTFLLSLTGWRLR